MRSVAYAWNMGRGKRRQAKSGKHFFRSRYIGRLPDEDELSLYERLLEDNDSTVVVPILREEEAELQALLTRGHFLPGMDVLLFKMENSACHRNAADLWLSGREPGCQSQAAGCTLMSGYALSDDNLWRQHSWVVTKEGQLVETTTPRSRYFGYVLEGEEAEAFAWANWP